MPRIRSLKPEAFQDETLGTVSRDARLLFVGLITLADDAGRFRASHTVVLGHVFPYDNDAPKKLGGWLNELLESGLIDVYEFGGLPYGRLPNWEKHQKISNPTESRLPEMNGSHS